MDRQLRYLHLSFEHQIRSLLDVEYFYIKCLVLMQMVLARVSEDSSQRHAILSAIDDYNTYRMRNVTMKNELINIFIQAYSLCLNSF